MVLLLYNIFLLNRLRHSMSFLQSYLLFESHITYQCCLRGSVNRVGRQAINYHHVVVIIILEFLWRRNRFCSRYQLRQRKRSVVMSAPAGAFRYATVVGVAVAGFWTVRGRNSVKLNPLLIMYLCRFYCV